MSQPALAPDPAPTVPANMSFSAVIAAMRQAHVCRDCGKTLTVLNIAGHRRPFRAERITPDTHCACPGGPAYVAPQIDLESFVTAVFDGAIGDSALPFASAEEACCVVEQLLVQRAGRALTKSESVKVGMAATLEFNRREAIAQTVLR